MKRSIFTLLCRLVWGALAAVLPFNLAYAHEGGPQLALDRYQAAPGETLTLNGGNLGTDLEVQIRLVADNVSKSLGSALCDGHGDFTREVTLPGGLEPGTYDIQIIDTSVQGSETVMASASLRIDPNSQANPAGGLQVFENTTKTPTEWIWVGALAVFVLVSGMMILLFRKKSA